MKKERYIKDVLNNINASYAIKKRIREDLSERIDHAMESEPFFDVVESIGTPEEVAKEFTENLEEADANMTKINVGFMGLTSNRVYEYKSERSLFGLPLIHINVGGRYTTRQARGIIAIGDAAAGVIALGGVSVGVIAFGGIGIGLLGLGGIGIGLLGLGGVGVGLYAFGGVAVGLYEAFGAVSHLFNR